MTFYLRLFPGKNNGKTFKRMQKIPFFGSFSHFGAKRSFPRNSVLASFFTFLSIILPFFKNKKINGEITSNTGFRRTHGRTDKHEFIIRPFQLKPGAQKKANGWDFSSQCKFN